MKLIKKPMTLEQYEAKYPHYQTKLISFSDNEIKEFNNKFHKSNGKDIPNKYALLEKYKWVHIKDRYYQIPSVSKLGKAGIGLVGAAAIACAVVLPLTLNKSSEPIVNVTEDEFKANLLYLYNNKEDRKFACKGTQSMIEHLDEPERYDIGVLFETEGYDSKLLRKFDLGEKITYQHYDEKAAYEYMSSEENVDGYWVRKALEAPKCEDFFICGFKDYSDLFSKSKKINGNTYKIESVDVDNVLAKEAIDSGKTVLSSECTIEFSFNENKTLKAINEDITIHTEDGGEKNTGWQNTKVEFYDLGNHKIEEMEKFVKPSLQEETMEYSSEGEGYYHSTSDPLLLTDSVVTSFKIEIDGESSQPAQIGNFSINYDSGEEEVPLTEENVGPITYLEGGEGEEKPLSKDTDYSIVNNIISFTKVFAKDDIVTIKITPNDNYDYCYASTDNSALYDSLVGYDEINFNLIEAVPAVAAESVQYFLMNN